jgi:GNAT superfamily N-acetyltransferase
MTYIMDERTTIRFAQETELGLILQFIKELAEYEGLLDKVVATEETLRKTLFQNKNAEVLFCEYDNQPVGFAVFFHNFSTFIGKPGIYLEDLYIKPEMRHQGLGKKIMTVLGEIAMERDCARVEWACLDWNQKSIDFYLGIGAEPLADWTVYRTNGPALKKASAS